MPRSIIDIEVKDEAFKKFLELFKTYQDNTAKMKGVWTLPAHPLMARQHPSLKRRKPHLMPQNQYLPLLFLLAI